MQRQYFGGFAALTVVAKRYITWDQFMIHGDQNPPHSLIQIPTLRMEAGN